MSLTHFIQSTRDELIAAFCSLLDCHKSVEVLVRELHALKLDPTTRAKMQEQSLLQEAKDLIHLWFTADSPGQCILDTARELFLLSSML